MTHFNMSINCGLKICKKVAFWTFEFFFFFFLLHFHRLNGVMTGVYNLFFHSFYFELG